LNDRDFRRFCPPKEETTSRRRCRDANRFSPSGAGREKPTRFGTERSGTQMAIRALSFSVRSRPKAPKPFQ
jgi:hypothetical protein